MFPRVDAGLTSSTELLVNLQGAAAEPPPKVTSANLVTAAPPLPQIKDFHFLHFNHVLHSLPSTIRRGIFATDLPSKNAAVAVAAAAAVRRC